MLLVLG